MKRHSFVFLSAGFLTAFCLAACQPNGGNKAPVKDGRSAKAKSGQADQKLKALTIECQGTINVDGNSMQVAKKLDWNPSQRKDVELLDPVNINEEDGSYKLELTPATETSPMLMGLVVSNIEKDKNIRLAALPQSKVKLYLENDGTKKIKVNVLCGTSTEQALIAPIKLDANKKMDLICRGNIGTSEGRKNLHLEEAVHLSVGTTNNVALEYDGLGLAKEMPSAKMSVASVLSADMKKADIKLSLEIADKKLKVIGDVKNDATVVLQLNSISDKQSLNYRCFRPETETKEEAPASEQQDKPAKDETLPKITDVPADVKIEEDKSVEVKEDTKEDEKSKEEAKSEDSKKESATTASTTTTTLPKAVDQK